MKMKCTNTKYGIVGCPSLAAFTIIVIIFIISSCSKSDTFSKEETPYHHNVLNDIYIAMAYNPDSALSMINDFSDSTDLKILKKAEFHEYNVLLAEARYKCNLENINDFELNEAVTFFDSIAELYPTDKEMLLHSSRANYYAGTAEEEKENFKDAFVCYLEALKTIEKIGGIGNNRKDIIHFKALIFVRLGDILYWLDAYEAAIECLENANTFFLQEDNINAVIRNNIIMAIMFAHSYNYDKTFRHLIIADSLIMQHDNDSPLKYITERINASLMYNIGYHDEPFQTMLRQYKTLESPNLKMEAAGVLGDMYYSKGMLDSAIYYYEQYFPDNRYSTIDAANHIVEISLKTSNNELIAKYGPILLEETNKELMLSTIKTDLSSLYEQYKIEINNEKTFKTILKYLGVLLLITFVIFIVSLYLLHHKKIIHNNELNKKDYYINILQEKIDEKSSENKHFKQKISNLENELYYIKNKKYLTHAPFDMKLKELIETNSLCQHLIEISRNISIKTNTSYPDLILSEKEQKTLIDLFNDKYDNAFNKIITEHNGLKYSDNLYFCLYILGMDEKHISAVTGKTYNTIYNRTKRIQEILGSNESIKEILRNIII